MGRKGIGEFEHQVMLTVLRKGGESYSVDIVSDLEERTGREVAVSAAFVVLRRLEEKGLLESRMAEPDPSEGGHPRRYFRLKPAGIAALKQSRRTFLALWDGLEPLLDER